jgi:maleate isomerase
MSGRYRIGLIVPSSNTTMETEIPEMLRRRSAEEDGETFTFHSSRAVLHNVDKGSLDRMVSQLDRCTNELVDSRVEAMAYACLVAMMARGPGAHFEAEERMAEIASGRGADPAISSSAGALVRALEAHGFSKVAILTPYVDSLTQAVVTYLGNHGLTVTDAISLRVSDNVKVAELDPMRLPGLARQLDLNGADALILSACVQMPSLPAIAVAERELDLPVLSAGTATVYDILTRLGLHAAVPDAGAVLSGEVRGLAK